MEIKEGMEVRLKSLSEIDIIGHEGEPSIVLPMKKNFGKIVTIRKINKKFDNVCWFSIEEDGKTSYSYTTNWLDSMNLLPEHLFKI